MLCMHVCIAFAVTKTAHLIWSISFSSFIKLHLKVIYIFCQNVAILTAFSVCFNSIKKKKKKKKTADENCLKAETEIVYVMEVNTTSQSTCKTQGSS